MKIRLDYVTNSSSVSYATATVQALQQFILMGGAMGLAVSSLIDQHKNDQNDSDVGSQPQSTEMAASTPDREIDWDQFLYSNTDYGSKISKIDQEILNYQAEWESMQDGIAQEDYEQVKEDYDQYIQYLNDLRDACGEIEDEKALEVSLNEAAEEQRMDWIDQRKNDYDNAKDDIADVRSAIAGYQQNGLDTSELEGELNMLLSYSQDLNSMLAGEGVDYAYEAEDKPASSPPAHLIKQRDDFIKKAQQAIAQMVRDNQRKEDIRAAMVQYQNDYQAATDDAYFWDWAHTIADYTSKVADVSVEILSYVTGPAGQIVKTKYDIAKNIGTSVSEAVNDSENAASHLLKGAIKTTTGLVKDKAGMDKWGKQKYWDVGMTFVEESSNAVIDEVNNGKPPKNLSEVYDRTKTGLVKGTLNTTVNTATSLLADHYLPKVDIDRDWGDHDVKIMDAAFSDGYNAVTEVFDEAGTNGIKSLVGGEVGNIVKDVANQVHDIANATEKGAK